MLDVDNVAEGFEYNNNPDFIRFLNYAKGSSGEFRNKLIILNQTAKIDDKVFRIYMQKAWNFQVKQRV